MSCRPLLRSSPLISLPFLFPSPLSLHLSPVRSQPSHGSRHPFVAGGKIMGMNMVGRKAEAGKQWVGESFVGERGMRGLGRRKSSLRSMCGKDENRNVW
ncbi:hypothetical protein HOY82DRAFT_572883 [Tuber indicum]|nr:hypothetical protein HOY82DRAFT_572883 [Tuber indicum]